MAVIKIEGLDEYIKKLEQLGAQGREICEEAVKIGGGVIADAVRQEIEAIPIDNHFGTSENPVNGLRQIQKDGLLDSLGIAPVEDDRGYINVKVGFDGYNKERTKKYPNGKPNKMIARSLESGTSFSKKIRFFNAAVNRSKQQATNKMAQYIEQKIDENMR